MKTKHLSFLILVLSQLLVSRCKDDTQTSPENIDYRQEMREFVINLKTYAKSYNSDFIVLPQNGQELITDNGEADGIPQTAYLQAIDATGRESMFWGYYNDDEETPQDDKQHLLGLCLLCEQNNIKVLATDYCSSHPNMDNSYQINEQYGFISFAADQRDLNNIPNYPELPHNVNSDDISDISQAKNFLYLINSENFNTKQDFINAVSITGYDVIIMDLFHNQESYTPAEVEQLKTKPNGGNRLVFCYLSIGEAEDYRYYWQQGWSNNKPNWLEPENPDWAGNYKVKYWDKSWQDIIYGNDNSYLQKILDAGFNGVYLDIIDAFEYFEDR